MSFITIYTRHVRSIYRPSVAASIREGDIPYTRLISFPRRTKENRDSEWIGISLPIAVLQEISTSFALSWSLLLLWEVLAAYCKRIYFRAAKFSRIKPYEANSRVLIFAHMPVNCICPIVIVIFTHINFSHIRPCAKCAKICTARKFLRLQYIGQIKRPRRVTPSRYIYYSFPLLIPSVVNYKSFH